MRCTRLRAKCTRRSDAGDTLIEIIIAVTIIALAAGPLLGALVESIAGSAEHRALATLDTYMRSLAETAKADLELSPPFGHGSITATGTSVSSALFSGAANFDRYAISGTGIAPTTLLLNEHNSSGTATLSTPATKSEASEPLTIGYGDCSTSYHLLDSSAVLSGPIGTGVTLFATGFVPGVAWTAFTIRFGKFVVTPTGTQSEQAVDASGNISLTFEVPTVISTSTYLTHPFPISVTSGGVSATSPADELFRVTDQSNSGPVRHESAYRAYRVGIAEVQYWTPISGDFVGHGTCVGHAAQHSGVEKLTVFGHAPGVSDALTVVIRNPAYSFVPVPSATMTVTSINAARPSTRTPTTTTLVFVATMTPALSNPTPSGTVIWTVVSPGGTNLSSSCRRSKVSGTGNTEIYTCALPNSNSTQFGVYRATATYPKDAYNATTAGTGTAVVYAPNGSGTATVFPTSVTASSTGHSSVVSLTFTYTAAATASTGGGSGNGEVEIKVPASWTAPQATPGKTGTPGYCTATGGQGALAVRIVTGVTPLIVVSGVTLNPGQTLTVRYARATVPTSIKKYTFTVLEGSVPTRKVHGLRVMPQVTVHA